jgi:hypothetical protein
MVKYPPSIFCIIPALLLHPCPSFTQDDIGISETISEEPFRTGSETTTMHEPATAAHAESTFPDNSGTIVIRTIPDGVTIDINGTRLGRTPWNRKGFLPGLYRVKLDKQGYRSFQRTVRVKSDDTVYIVHDLEVAGAIPQAAAGGTRPVRDSQSEIPAAPPIPPSQPQGTGTLYITCTADSATVVINKVKLGVTPFIREGFQPGFYEVELKKSGYESFRKTVRVENDDTAHLDADLLPFFGRLIITSTPGNAKVLINEIAGGTTPYDSTGIKPDLYRIRLELDNYVPWTTQRTIVRNRTDTLKVSLISVAEHDSLSTIHARRFKIFRRIFFGTLTAGFAVAGTYYNSRAEQQLSVEQESWNAYMEANLTTADYDERFAAYQEKAEATDLLFKRRNVMYVLGGIFCAGFALSIPF